MACKIKVIIEVTWEGYEDTPDELIICDIQDHIDTVVEGVKLSLDNGNSK